MSRRLNKSSPLPKSVKIPAYTPEKHGAGIVHFGLGAFHRAHQAVYTDAALANSGGDWRIIGVSLRSAVVANELRPQDNLYTLVIKDGSATKARIIGSLAMALCFANDRGPVLAALTAPATKILSLTVTEKAYGIDRATGGVNISNSAISADLRMPDTPNSVIGLIVWALGQRRKNNLPPFTVLCCDNLPDNGGLLRGGVVDFATRIDADLGEWIAQNVAFPATMVDRITPAKTDSSLTLTERLIGVKDQAATETEPFSQWVIEDDFPTGRPDWEAGGALFVQDVAPYENMKLRMLNGAHSMLAYCGFLSGHEFVCDVMADPALRRLVTRHLQAAAKTLAPLDGIDLDAYAHSLLSRFGNPEIKHRTFQIAMDGTEKLPQRILQPTLAALQTGQSISTFAFATAAWMRYCLAETDDGQVYDLNDPLQDQIARLLKNADTPAQIASALFKLDSVFPQPLLQHDAWQQSVLHSLSSMIEHGMKQAVRLEADSL